MQRAQQYLDKIVEEIRSGLLINDGQSWLHQRRLMQPAFHRQRIAAYGAVMTNATANMLEQWQTPTDGDAPLDIADEMMCLTLGIVGQTLFDMDLSQETSTVGQAVSELLKLIGNYVYTPFPPLNIPTPRNRRIRAAIRELDKVVYGIINERRNMMEAQIILAAIAQQYQLRMIPGHPVVPQALVSLRPKYGLRMTIRRRQEK